MDRVSRSCMIAAVLLGGYFWASAALAHDPEQRAHRHINADPATAPEMVLGTAGTQYQLFTPQAVVEAGGGGQPGAAAFTDLTDTPSTYSGAKGQIPVVNSAESALVFESIPSAPLSDATPKDLGTAAAGTGTNASREDHVHKRPDEIADNSAAIAVNTGDIARKPGLSDADPKPVTGAAATGSGTKASRDDHAHAFSNYGTAVKAVAASSSAGNLDQVSRVDHVHAAATQSKAPLSLLAVLTWSGNNTTVTLPSTDIETPSIMIVADRPGLVGWGQLPAPGKSTDVTLPPGITCKVSRSSASSGVLVTVSGNCAGGNREGAMYLIESSVVAGSGSGGATNLSDDVPQRVSTDTASAGTKSLASRSDHTHLVPGDYRIIPEVIAPVEDGFVLTTLDVANGTYGWKAAGGGGGGATSFTGLADTPGTYSGAKGQVPVVNEGETALAFGKLPPDVSGDVQQNADDIGDLDFLTQDLIAGIPATAWTTVNDASTAGIATFASPPACDAARGGTYTASVTDAANNHAVVRIKSGFSVNRVRVRLTADDGATFDDLISGWVRICSSADNSVDYFVEVTGAGQVVYGGSVAKAEVQTTGDTHVGSSKYQGDPTKVERWAIVGDTTHIPAGKAYPAITGQAGKFLAVNSAATGVEWKAGGGGGGGGSGGGAVSFSFTSLGKIEDISTAAQRHTMTQAERTACAAARLFQVVIDDTNNDLNDTNFLYLAQNPAADNSVLGIFEFNTAGNGAIAVEMKCSGDAGSWLVDSLFDPGDDVDATLYAVTLDGGGGGGGSSGPSIPDPTAAGALDYLRVNAAGAAYELADFPAIPAGSTDTPAAATANGFRGTSPKWSPGDHSHPIAGNDTLAWTRAQVSTLTGGGASGGVTCDGSTGYPQATECRDVAAGFRRGDYDFFMLRVARYDDNDNNEPVHVSGCMLMPGIPGAVFANDEVADTACTANSGKNSANTFRQYDVFVKFGNTSPYIQVRLPNYNSYGVTNVTVTLTGVRR